MNYKPGEMIFWYKRQAGGNIGYYTNRKKVEVEFIKPSKAGHHRILIREKHRTGYDERWVDISWTEPIKKENGAKAQT